MCRCPTVIRKWVESFSAPHNGKECARRGGDGSSASQGQCRVVRGGPGRWERSIYGAPGTALGQGAYPVSPCVHLSLVLCALGLGVKPRAVKLPRKGYGCRPGSRGSPALRLRLDVGEPGDRLGEVEPAGMQHLVGS